jgi:hypothetical protein
MSTMFDPNRGSMGRRRSPLRVWVVRSLIAFCALEIGGCSTARPPTETLSKAEMDLRAAVEARADEFAPMDLQGARDKLDQVKQLVTAKKYEEARRLAEVVQVEAELAQAKAEAEIMRRAAEDLQRRMDALRSENERSAIQRSSGAPAKESDYGGK